ncbi:MAG TPA: MmgE/PrpD family protein [Micropepsaceae bacterium]|nr:MmgE/PrpD family protein [Micropepsaceae bacterium]
MNKASELEFWADRLLRRPDNPDPVQSRIVDLLSAFAVGLTTDEGRALARLHGAQRGTAATAATVSAIARQSECDDIELTSCVTPGAVVIPVALAYGRDCSSENVARAICRGYDAGIIVGRAIGGARALPKTWPTLLAAPLMAAVTHSFLHDCDRETLVHAMSLALAGSSGSAGRPAGAPSGRWIIFAEAVARGIHAAEAARAGFKGDPLLCSGEWWQTQAGHGNVDQSVFTDPVWPHIGEADYKPFPIARQGATAVEAFQQLLASGLDPATIEAIEAFVPAMNVAMLTRPAIAGDRVSLLCNLGFQLACAAFAPDVLMDPQRGGATPALIDFSKRVTITAAPESNNKSSWPARVMVKTKTRKLVGELEQIRLGAPLRNEADLREKWQRILHTDDRRAFFENVVNAPSGSHAMLWDWVQHRLAGAAA